MKIGEAKELYSAQVRQLWSRKTELTRQKKEIDEGKNKTMDREGVVLELSNVEDKYKIAQKFMEDFMEYTMNLENAEASRRQADAMEDAAIDMAKCMETARRIAKGGKVPAKDEQKLMEFSMEMYLAAKNAAMLVKDPPDEEYDSLWEDEEEDGEQPPVSDVVDGMECMLDMPSGVSAGVSSKASSE